jgi:putative chitinase
MGNGTEDSGEGFLYCGRGAIQLTGKENYTKFASSIDMAIDEAVAYCETINGAIESACYFWNTHNLNTVADKGDFVTLTKKINGGTTGLPERQEIWHKALKVL